MVIQKEVLHTLPVNAIFTQVSPDEKYFIKSDKINFEQAYDNFLSHKIFTQQFLISPKPSNIQDILMNQKKLSYFFDFVVANSEEYFEIKNNAILEYCSMKNQYIPNNFLHPLHFSHKNKQQNIPVFVGGYPKMLLVDVLAQTFPEDILERLKQEHFERQNQSQKFVQFQIKNFTNLFALEIEYIKRVIQNICLSNEKVIAFVGFLIR